MFNDDFSCEFGGSEISFVYLDHQAPSLRNAFQFNYRKSQDKTVCLFLKVCNNK